MIYVLCALAFGVMIAFDRDPALEASSRQRVATALDFIRHNVIDGSVAVVRSGSDRVAAVWNGWTKPSTKPSAPAPVKTVTVSKPPQKVALPRPAPLTPPKPAIVEPKIEPVAPSQVKIAEVPDLKPVKITPQRQPKPIFVPPSAPTAAPARPPLAPAELVRVSMRLRDNLTKEMLENFSLFLYVSKAENGLWAQRMYVFNKDASGNLSLLYNWAASTGREKDEVAPNGTRQPSYTPQGYYQLDPNRMYKKHFSGQWHEPMPNSMFFNWENKGLQTGLAIHGASAHEIAALGTRASAGCIRLAPENAALLFNLIKAQYRGLAPRFAYDRRTATMSNQGMMMYDAAGNLKMAEGYKVLVFIENFGGQNVVAAVF